MSTYDIYRIIYSSSFGQFRIRFLNVKPIDNKKQKDFNGMKKYLYKIKYPFTIIKILVINKGTFSS